MRKTQNKRRSDGTCHRDLLQSLVAGTSPIVCADLNFFFFWRSAKSADDNTCLSTLMLSCLMLYLITRNSYSSKKNMIYLFNAKGMSSLKSSQIFNSGFLSMLNSLIAGAFPLFKLSRNSGCANVKLIKSVGINFLPADGLSVTKNDSFSLIVRCSLEKISRETRKLFPNLCS